MEDVGPFGAPVCEPDCPICCRNTCPAKRYNIVVDDAIIETQDVLYIARIRAKQLGGTVEVIE